MINKRKVRLMARTAMYLKHEGTEDIPNPNITEKIMCHFICGLRL